VNACDRLPRFDPLGQAIVQRIPPQLKPKISKDL
jgi:hypothetical protein